MSFLSGVFLGTGLTGVYYCWLMASSVSEYSRSLDYMREATLAASVTLGNIQKAAEERSTHDDPDWWKRGRSETD